MGEEAAPADEEAAPADEEAAPADEEDNKMTIDGDWELGNGTAGFGDVTTISGENGKMMAAGEEIGTYTFKELDDVVAGFKGEIECELINGDVEGKLSEDGNELELTVTIAFVSVTAKFNRKGGEEAAPADEEAAPADEEAAPADEEAAPAEEEDNKMTIDGDWELGNGTAGFGDVTTISGENGKMMAAGE